MLHPHFTGNNDQKTLTTMMPEASEGDFDSFHSWQVDMPKNNTFRQTHELVTASLPLEIPIRGWNQATMVLRNNFNAWYVEDPISTIWILFYVFSNCISNSSQYKFPAHRTANEKQE